MTRTTKSLFVAVATLAIASGTPALAQDPHAHDVSAQAAPTAAPVECPAGVAGMASRAMPGMGSGMQQNMGNMQQMQMMQQTMQQMHTEMQQMHSEMMQMRQEMQRRGGKAN